MKRASRQSSEPFSGDWQAIRDLIPYLMVFPKRVLGALLFLMLAKLCNVFIPYLLKLVVDDLSSVSELIIVPISLLFAYGLFSFCSKFFGELRDIIFSKVTENTMRSVALKVFAHLNMLDLEYHLSRETGGLSRDIERGTSGISFLLQFMLFNILPTIFEIGLIAVIIFINFGYEFSLIVVLSTIVYILFSAYMTEWTNKYVRLSNELDSASNTRAVDSLLNHETVKYFNNEQYEIDQYDEHLKNWESARLKRRLAVAVLNSGQALIIAISMTILMILMASEVVAQKYTVGDFVMINAYMIQLFIPLNFLGFVYREVKNSLANIERMLKLLKIKTKVIDKPNAQELTITDGQIVFDKVNFGYNKARQIIKNISFKIEKGKKLAIVGTSGSGKSTIAKLLFRLYDTDSGRILIDNQDISDFKQTSVRSSIAVVPQDTVLFNNTILQNIQFGNTEANTEQVNEAIKISDLARFIKKLPQGDQTLVGERGLKLSGGEKQKVAIARATLKNAKILVFDEATSSLDSNSEGVILKALERFSEDQTTIVIAHRLSTIVKCDSIIVMDHGEIVEQGTHKELLVSKGLYAELWEHQQSQFANKQVV